MTTPHRHRLTRKDFLRLGGIALGGAGLACAGGSKLVEFTAVPTTARPTTQPATQSAPTAHLAPTEQPTSIPTASPVPAQPLAEFLFVNGNIVTMNANQPTVRALAVRDGRILALGDEQELRTLAGASTSVIDLHGRTVTPGLIDAHCHLSACGLLGTAFVDISFPQVRTIQEMQTRLSEKIAVTPKGEWIVASGWLSFDGRYPDKHDLDPVSPDHPVFAINQGGHMAAVNSLALEMAGVNASTPDPGNGRFLRQANNEPSGVVLNHPAMDVFRRLWPPDLLSEAVYEASILNPQVTFARMGVTSFQDVYARDLDRVQAYFKLARDGKMTLRGQVMNVLEYIQELDGRIGTLEAVAYEDEMMHLAGGKFQVDGALEASFTHAPHDGIAYNIPIWKPNDLNQAVSAFHDAGYQVALHTIGDAAMDMALDAIENAMNHNPRPDPRHRIEHSVLATPAAMQRTKDLGVVISTQPTLIWAFADGAARIWGEERMQQMIPTRTWLEMGVPLCLSSDAPSMPWWDPQTSLCAAILRRSPSKKPVSPEQALTIEEALYAHTLAGAYADFAEGIKGSLEAGKLADLIVWHDDPYAAACEDLPGLTIDLTMVGGKVVHTNP